MFPGAVNADFSGFPGSFWQRPRVLLGTCIRFILLGGEAALTEELPNPREIRSEAELEHFARRRARQSSRFSDELDSDEPPEPSKVHHRAITSLYAGTATAAGHLNGRVRVLGLSTCPRYTDLSGHVNYLFSISPPGHASHFQVRRRSIVNSEPCYGSGASMRSGNTPRLIKT